jgi:hypothetical protein
LLGRPLAEKCLNDIFATRANQVSFNFDYSTMKACLRKLGYNDLNDK